MDYASRGRTRQKQRTFDALVAAARQLIALGHTPTVEDAAASAEVSRTTAYRYFPNQAVLLAAAHPEIETTSLLTEDASADVGTRLAAVIEAFTDLIVSTEPQQRATLRVALELGLAGRKELPLRQGRAIGWIDEALAPLRGSVPNDKLHRLVLAIRSATGIEALVWLTDVAGLSRREATDIMKWSAAAMLHAAVCGDAPQIPSDAKRATTTRRVRPTSSR